MSLLKTYPVNQSWSPVHIISWVRFAVIILGFSQLFDFNVYAQNSFNFNIGDNISISSDKAYRKTSENLFEAIGNVVVTHYSEALYGESGSFNMETGDVHFKGNVRYVGPEYTIYGTELFFNFKTKYLSILNSRILASSSKGSFTIVGKKISRVKPNVYVAEEAEYTTCKDCPESWSVYGERVQITAGEYVHVYKALLKINRVSIMFLPYIVFPIKKGRQSGLLFPDVSISFTEGIGYTQPVFWAISDFSDLTYSPGTGGRRGFFHKARYRQNLADQTWFEFNGLQAFDRIYTSESGISEESSGRHTPRNFAHWEHRYRAGQWLTHHFSFDLTRDLDIERDYGEHTNKFHEGSEFGGGGFIDFRQPMFTLSAEAYQKRNMLDADKFKFDEGHVQLNPQFKLSMIPYPLLQTDVPGLEKIILGLDTTYEVFDQKHVRQKDFIRNATRWGYRPFLNWHNFTAGPMHTSSRLEWDHLNYEFPNKAIDGDENSKFSKTGVQTTSQVSVEVDKIYGLAYKENIPVEQIKKEDLAKFQKEKDEKKEEEKEKIFENTVGELPDFSNVFTRDSFEKLSDSFRHAQEYKILHHYIADEKMEGNERFREQIEYGNGWFDYRDTILSNYHRLGGVENKTGISKKNTAEFQWNNSLIRKRSRFKGAKESLGSLRESYIYSEVATFKLSQGYELNDEEDKESFKDNLTRLSLNASFTVRNTNFNIRDYYFYQNGKHISSFSFSQKMTYGTVATGFTYNSFGIPAHKNATFASKVFVTSRFHLQYQTDFDLVTKEESSAKYGILYSPSNECWRMELVHYRDEIDRSISFNFYLNFSNNTFTSITGS